MYNLGGKIMNIICSKQKLQEAISIVTKAITGKTTMPILEGIYIEAANNCLTLIGSDMLQLQSGWLRQYLLQSVH